MNTQRDLIIVMTAVMLSLLSLCIMSPVASSHSGPASLSAVNARDSSPAFRTAKVGDSPAAYKNHVAAIPQPTPPAEDEEQKRINNCHSFKALAIDATNEKLDIERKIKIETKQCQLEAEQKIRHADLLCRRNAEIRGQPRSTATWRIEGNDLVVRWWNRWTNRYPWNASGKLSGIAIDHRARGIQSRSGANRTFYRKACSRSGPQSIAAEEAAFA